MSEHEHAHDGPHIVPIPTYLIVFGVLMVGTILTYVMALIDLDWIFPGANTLVALGIAFAKMICVVLIFMHVWYGTRLIKLVVVASFFCLAIMFAFTMQDYLTRHTGIF